MRLDVRHGVWSPDVDAQLVQRLQRHARRPQLPDPAELGQQERRLLRDVGHALSSIDSTIKPGVRASGFFAGIDSIAICDSVIAYCNYETRRENPVPAPGGRNPPRPEPRDDAAGSGSRSVARDEKIPEPVVSFADRKRRAPASDEFDANAAGEVLRRPSGLPGRRSAWLPYRADFRRARAGRSTRSVARQRRGAIFARSRNPAGVVEARRT